MANFLYNILVINAQTDQLVPWLSGLRRLTTVILMRCGFPGVGSNPRNEYICFNCNYLFLLFLSFLLSTGVSSQVLHVHFYLFRNQSVNDTPFWYHLFKKTKTLSSTICFYFFLQIHVRVHVRLVYQTPGIRGWLRLLLVALPRLFCLPFFYWKHVTFSFLYFLMMT